jgi:sugar-specific transcriptional regulator TrmB
MSLKGFLDTLSELGLRHSDSKVYIYLAKKGPHSARDVCKEMKLAKQQVYPCLKNLQKKGIVQATLKRPALFTASPLETVLGLLVNQKTREARDAEKHRSYILSAWQAMKADFEHSGSVSP